MPSAAERGALRSLSRYGLWRLLHFGDRSFRKTSHLPQLHPNGSQYLPQPSHQNNSYVSLHGVGPDRPRRNRGHCSPSSIMIPSYEISQVQNWLEQLVIGLNLCPFAKKEFRADTIRFQLSRGTSNEACLEELLEEFHHLDEVSETATTLLIYSHRFSDFADYLDHVETSEKLAELEGYEGIYQIASFHPDYQFADAPPDDPANLTNRAPYPILHLLREADLSRAIAQHPDPEGIPIRNQELCRSMGIEALRALLTDAS